ncbi:MAG TPA: NAD(P)H-hydrate dehydratase [Spirochaetota bacterium]|nr:NAD(P)H-hydrate dehydratase [Spirochaetota bacterium]HPC40399.1 NAD(P)H-hydrate dehydratase [Spirochaetota bacterium]HPL17318.1 NAD(P)H-hydrate dehydratase [Spirochaetota bacterium]HQF06466.1 NAD(P)H-hydrate dehydratase [Spirochaetota bacterium]HQH98051.1 NAD(P)H-hydrate dehydratase [Spirochaetota bacterium]
MKVVTASEMQEIDRVTIRELGLPGEVLMGLAGKAVAERALAACPSMRKAAVFSGTGNNGGDGFVAAYFLAMQGLQADVFLVGDEDRISETSRVYFSLCKKSGIRVTAFDKTIDPEGYDCIVDAILGTGFSGAVRGPAADAIRAINDADAFVVAVDVPSGLPSDGAAPESEAVAADCTVTIGLPKISLVTYPGREYAGTLHVADIGFPGALTGADGLSAELIDDEFFENNAISAIESEYCAAPDLHKGARGHLLILGGFDGMEGAAMLAASAAFETGVGLATLATTEKARSSVAGRIPELMTISLGTDAADAMKDVDAILRSKRWDSLILGPGLGRSDYSRQIAEAVINTAPACGIRKVLIDGDGLFHLAGLLKEGRLDQSVSWVITPHFLEASRLLGLSVDEIKSNRYNAASLLSEKLRCTALLKGPGTIVAGDGRRYINTTGSPALATAGSGDVLAGIIGALLLRKAPAVHAAAWGAWVHGKAADLQTAAQSGPILKSSDLIPYIRKAMNHK